MNRFLQLKGLENLLNLVYNSSKNHELKQSTCPIIILEQIILLIQTISRKVKGEIRIHAVKSLVDRLASRLEITTDEDTKNSKLLFYTKFFDSLGQLGFGDNLILMPFYKKKETTELSYSLLFLKHGLLEQKLHALLAIKGFAKNIEAMLVEEFHESPQIYYFNYTLFLTWLFENHVFYELYNRVQHKDVILQSSELLLFVARYCHEFPNDIIEMIWNSCQTVDRQIVRTIYDAILNMTSYINLETAVKFYQKISTIDIKNYNEDSTQLLSEFTSRCLKLLVIETNTGIWKIDPKIQEKFPNFYFGIPTMLQLIMDDNQLSNTLTDKIQDEIIILFKRYPYLKVFLRNITLLDSNIAKGISVYQSLHLLQGYLIAMMNIPSHSTLLDALFDNLITGKNEKEGIIDRMIRSYNIYWQHVREILKDMRQVGSEYDESWYMEQQFIGKYSHKRNILERLKALEFFMVNKLHYQPLTFTQFELLWISFVLKPNFEFETKLFLEMISHRHRTNNREQVLLFNDKDIRKIFDEILCDIRFCNPKKLNIDKFKCFKFFFLLANTPNRESASGIIEPSVLQPNEIDKGVVGADYLWECVVDCEDDMVSKEVVSFIIQVYVHSKDNTHNRDVFLKMLQSWISSLKTIPRPGGAKKVERLFVLLASYINSIDHYIEQDLYKSVEPAESKVNPKHDVQITINFHPYEITKFFTFEMQAKLGYVKNIISEAYNLNLNDFDLVLGDQCIKNEDLNKPLEDLYSINEARIFKRLPDLNHTTQLFMNLMEPHINFITDLLLDFDLGKIRASCIKLIRWKL